MKVFISWSGERSQKIALALRDWLPNVIQALEPWMSAEDIDAGARWSDEVAAQLANTGFGVICLTPENLSAPWLHFEAGAVAKSLERARVVPYLYGGLTPGQLVGPLAQFQAKLASEAPTLELVRSINERMPTPLARSMIERNFAMWWPELRKALDGIPAADGPEASAPPRQPTEMLEELLTMVRRLSQNAETRGPHRLTYGELILASQALEAEIRRLENVHPSEVDPDLFENVQAQMEANQTALEAISKLTGALPATSGRTRPRQVL